MQSAHAAPCPAFSFYVESTRLRKPSLLGVNRVPCLDLRPDPPLVSNVLASEKEVLPVYSRCMCFKGTTHSMGTGACTPAVLDAATLDLISDLEMGLQQVLSHCVLCQMGEGACFQQRALYVGSKTR